MIILFSHLNDVSKKQQFYKFFHVPQTYIYICVCVCCQKFVKTFATLMILHFISSTHYTDLITSRDEIPGGTCFKLTWSSTVMDCHKALRRPARKTSWSNLVSDGQHSQYFMKLVMESNQNIYPNLPQYEVRVKTLDVVGPLLKFKNCFTIYLVNNII